MADVQALPAVLPARVPGLEVAELSSATVVLDGRVGNVHFLRDAHRLVFQGCDGVRSPNALVDDLVIRGFGNVASVEALLATVLGDLARLDLLGRGWATPRRAPAVVAGVPSVSFERTSGQPAMTDDQLQTTAAEMFREHGCVMLSKSFEPELVQAMSTDFLENYAARDAKEVERDCLRVGPGRYMFTIDLRAPYLLPAVYASERVMPIVQALLGDECVIQSVGVVCGYPGADEQHVHRDHPPLFPDSMQLGAAAPPYALHLVVPLVDLTEETGTTALWPGSHRVMPVDGEMAAWAAAGTADAETPWATLGDSYLMDFRIRHGGTPNRSSRPRPLLYIVYSRDWFQDRRNFDKQDRLLISRDEFEQIPEEHRRLFGDARPQFRPR